MTIPETIKLRGRIVRVDVSARGYVRVADAVCDARTMFSTGDEWERFKSNATPTEWQAVLYRCYNTALKEARQEAKSKK